MRKIRFFIINNGSSSVELVWDSFKSYVRGILILYKEYWDKSRGLHRVKLLQNIQRWEDLNKVQVTLEITQCLKKPYEDLKVLDAREIAQEMLYSQQRMFDYGPTVRKK